MGVFASKKIINTRCYEKVVISPPIINGQFRQICVYVEPVCKSIINAIKLKERRRKKNCNQHSHLTTTEGKIEFK